MILKNDCKKSLPESVMEMMEIASDGCWMIKTTTTLTFASIFYLLLWDTLYLLKIVFFWLKILLQLVFFPTIITTMKQETTLVNMIVYTIFVERFMLFAILIQVFRPTYDTSFEGKCLLEGVFSYSKMLNLNNSDSMFAYYWKVKIYRIDFL